MLVVLGETSVVLRHMFPQADAHVTTWRQWKKLRELTADYAARSRAVLDYVAQCKKIKS